MTRLPAIAFPAPAGMDATSDPMMLPAERGQYVSNVLVDQPGKLRAAVQIAGLINLPYSPDGVGWWYGSTPASDRLLIVMNGFLYKATPTVPPIYTEQFSGLVKVGSSQPFAVGKRVRFASYGSLTIMVQDGGIQPQKFDGTNLYQLGITAPAAPTLTNQAYNAGHTPNDSGPGMTGGNGYRVVLTYQDASSNESSPSPSTSVNITAANEMKVAWIASADPQVAFVNVYVSPPGSTVFYRDGQVAIAGGTTFYVQNVDNTITATTTIAPSAGENDIPHAASVIAVHKNHVFLNDTTNPATLQVSNLNNPTLWSSVTVQVTDGERITISTDQGDPITGLVPFGSLLGVWKRRGFFQLWGDTVSDFTVRAVHERGCIAPDSAVRCDNVLVFLSDDGFYTASFENGFLLKKLSKEIEALINPLATQVNGRQSLEGAWGAYCNNRYYCGVVQPSNSQTVINFFDFDAGGWGLLTL